MHLKKRLQLLHNYRHCFYLFNFFTKDNKKFQSIYIIIYYKMTINSNLKIHLL